MIKKISDQLGKLTIVAGRDGQVVGAPPRSGVGQWFKPGRPNDPDPRPDKPNEARHDQPFFCEIGDPHYLEAHLVLDQADIHLIHPSDKAWLKVYGKAETTYKSFVEEIAKHTSGEIPLELSSMAEGEIAVKPDFRTGAARPTEGHQVYEIIIPVENSNLELEPGLRGLAKIEGGSYTIAWWLMRWWHKLFHFQL
jgi:putative peptide zinc metalloprotease protein